MNMFTSGRLSTTEKREKRGRNRGKFPIVLDGKGEIPGVVSAQFDYPSLIAMVFTQVPASVIFRFGALSLAVQRGCQDPMVVEEYQKVSRELLQA